MRRTIAHPSCMIVSALIIVIILGSAPSPFITVSTATGSEFFFSSFLKKSFTILHEAGESHFPRNLRWNHTDRLNEQLLESVTRMSSGPLALSVCILPLKTTSTVIPSSPPFFLSLKAPILQGPLPDRRGSQHNVPAAPLPISPCVVFGVGSVDAQLFLRFNCCCRCCSCRFHRTPLHWSSLATVPDRSASSGPFFLHSLETRSRVSRLLLYSAQGRGHADHHTDRHPGRVDHKQLSDPSLHRPPSHAWSLKSSWQTASRRHGRITHQPEDVPYGRFGPDLPCCLSTVARVIKVGSR